jgi:hypothetical protein
MRKEKGAKKEMDIACPNVEDSPTHVTAYGKDIANRAVYRYYQRNISLYICLYVASM